MLSQSVKLPPEVFARLDHDLAQQIQMTPPDLFFSGPADCRACGGLAARVDHGHGDYPEHRAASGHHPALPMANI